MEHREVLEMRVSVANQKAREDSPQQAIGLGWNAAWRSQDELPHRLVRPLVFILSRVFAEQLIEFLEVYSLPGWGPIEARNDEGLFLDRWNMGDTHLDHVVVGQKAVNYLGGQIFEFQQVGQVSRSKFCDVRARLVRTHRPEGLAVWDEQQLALDP